MGNVIESIKKLYKIYILIVDLAIIFISYVITFQVRYGELPEFNFAPFLNASPYILIAAVIYLDMYKVLAFFKKSAYDVLKSIALVVTMLGITTIAITYMLQGFSFPRLILIVTPVVQFILLSLFNLFLLKWSRHISKPKSIMIICTKAKKESARLVKKVDNFIKNERIVKKLILDLSQERIIMRRLKEMDEIYLSADTPPEFKAEIIKRCMGGKQVIYVVPHVFEISLINAKIMQLEDTPAFMIDKLGLKAEQAFVKRMFDAIISFLGLLILSPFLAIIALLIKLTSAGPVFYKQERITKDNKHFNVIKFRTMELDAEKTTGPTLSEADDPRVTKFGKFLRRTRIDELPQLINVLKGEMSLVGPRPERPFFVEQFIHDIPEYSQRFVVKAGITGYAQIHGNYSTAPEDKLRYDLMYIRNYSLLLDIKLIFNTFKVLFTPGSAFKMVDNCQTKPKEKESHNIAKKPAI